MKKFAFALLCCPLFGQNGSDTNGTVVPTARPYEFITGRQRLEHFAAKTVGPTAIAKSFLSAGYQTWRRSPDEWSANYGGFSRRVGYKFARLGIANSIELGVSAAVNEDPRFFHLGHGGFAKRFNYAVTSAFTARRPDGRRTLSAGRFAGKIGSAFIANTWYPPSNNTNSDALRRIGYSFAFSAGFNIVKEYSPEIKRLFGRGR